jgi:hypothetical protein
MIRDYTVVVDTTTANANLTNEPLKPKSVTLSRTDLIAFQ